MPALATLKVGTRLASAILLYSFGAKTGEERGVLEPEITAACLAIGLDRTTITAALSDLREELLYLHYVGRRYRFDTKPNLNKLIAEEESKIGGEEVLEKIKAELAKGLEKVRGKAVVWPSDSTRIADRLEKFSIVYLDLSWAEKSPEQTRSDAWDWLEHRGKDKREYKNGLAFVVPESGQGDKARKGARTALAIAALIEQKKKYNFTPADDGKQPARSYTLSCLLNKSQVFEFYQVLLALSEAEDLTVKIEVRAIARGEFDRNWIENAIEEPLDELDIKATTRLE